MFEHAVRTDGVVTFWRRAAATDRTLVYPELLNLGLADCLPAQRRPTSLLKDAVKAVFADTNWILRPLGKSRRGCCLVAEDKVDDDTNHYTLMARAHLSKDAAEVTLAPPDRIDAVTAKYLEMRNVLTGDQVTDALVRICDKLQGIRLNDNGGCYWLPDAAGAAWHKAAHIFQRAAIKGVTTVYVIRTLLDARGVEAVTAAVVAEANRRAETIRQELRSGCGDKRTETIRLEAACLQGKIAEYERILGASLDALHQLLDQAAGTEVAAALTA